MKYRGEIDGLRAMAVIPVILFHAGFEKFRGGFVGVDVFFVISGYLITSIIIEDIENGRFSLLKFYERRARRILPAIFLIMACCIPFSLFWMLSEQFKNFSQSIVAVSLFISNVLFWRESGYFDLAAEEKPLLHTWSLAVEEQYYLLFPVFLIATWWFGRKVVFVLVIVIAVLSLMLTEWGWRNVPSANFLLAPFRAWELLAGSICAFVLSKRSLPGNDWWALTGVFLVLYSIFFFDAASIPFPSLYTLAPVSGVALIILYGTRETFIARILSSPPFIGIGLISYSAYLWHQPLFAFARIRSPTPPSNLLMVVLSITSLVLAYLSWRYVEQPFRRSAGGGVFTQKTVLIGSAAGLTGFLLAGLFMLSHERDIPVDWVEREKIIRDLKADREVAIGSGNCHFNGRQSQSLEEFVANWSCPGDGGSDLNPVMLAVYGDSHAADRAMAMRRAGIDVMQVSGASCPLVPRRQAPAYCGRLLELMHEKAAKYGIKSVVIANRMGEDETEEENILEVIKYWTGRYQRVIILTPMPARARFADIFVRFGPEAAANILPDMRYQERFLANIDSLDLPPEVSVIRSDEAFCGNRPDCSPIIGDTLLLMDDDHLSVAGAELFGLSLCGSLSEFLKDENIRGVCATEH